MISGKTIVLVFLYFFIINIVLHGAVLSSISGTYEDIDIFGSIGSGVVKVLPDYSTLPSGDNDMGTVIGDGAEDNSVGVVQGVVSWSFKRIFAFGAVGMALDWLDYIDASVGNDPDGTISNTYSGILDYIFSHIAMFFGTVLSVIMFVLGLMSLNIFSVASDAGLIIPFWLKSVMYLLYLPAYIVLAVYLVPIAIDMLKAIAQWVNSVTPFT